jgi:hypothetical protein
MLTLSDKVHRYGKLTNLVSAPALADLQELKARNINFARNLFDRAITLLPRVDAVCHSPSRIANLLIV